MIKRFFSILQRNWTYEIEYSYEIARMVFINVITFGDLTIVYHIPNAPKWVFWFFGIVPMIVFWWFYFRYSLGRFVQIRNNKKSAINVSPSQIDKINELYCKQPLYCKINGKYKKIMSSKEVKEEDDIILIMIGKHKLSDLKKIKQVIKKQ